MREIKFNNYYKGNLKFKIQFPKEIVFLDANNKNNNKLEDRDLKIIPMSCRLKMLLMIMQKIRTCLIEAEEVNTVIMSSLLV